MLLSRLFFFQNTVSPYTYFVFILKKGKRSKNKDISVILHLQNRKTNYFTVRLSRNDIICQAIDLEEFHSTIWYMCTKNIIANITKYSISYAISQGFSYFRNLCLYVCVRMYVRIRAFTKIIEKIDNVNRFSFRVTCHWTYFLLTYIKRRHDCKSAICA